MVEIKLHPSGELLQVPEGTLLSAALAACGVETPCGGQGRCGGCKVRVLVGEVKRDDAHRQILEKLKLPVDDWCLACRTVVEGNIEVAVGRSEMQVQTDCAAVGRSVRVEAAGADGFGIAVDLGSTTVVAQLVNLATGEVVDQRTGVNPQAAFGADIVSRMAYTLEHEDGLEVLSRLIRQFIGRLAEELCAAHSVAAGGLRRVYVVGNTVMHHLFGALPVVSLSQAPFEPVWCDELLFTPAELGWHLPACSEVRFLPCMGHFVGSDILAGIEACGMTGKNDLQLLIDLGTNGEMALGRAGKIIYTSTAAGPAFEGVNISCGMQARTGAVFSVRPAADAFAVKTIGGGTPCGLCGSGLIEAVSALLRMGRMDATGTLTGDAEYVDIAPGVRLTAADLREYQLAQAAIATGIDLLLDAWGVEAKDVAQVALTGGLGNYVEPQMLMELGLLPAGLAGAQFRKLPNAALQGCRMALVHTPIYNMYDKILPVVDYCALETHPAFFDTYCNHLYLGEV